jgi:hypothetical protein
VLHVLTAKTPEVTHIPFDDSTHIRVEASLMGRLCAGELRVANIDLVEHLLVSLFNLGRSNACNFAGYGRDFLGDLCRRERLLCPANIWDETARGDSTTCEVCATGGAPQATSALDNTKTALSKNILNVALPPCFGGQ